MAKTNNNDESKLVIGELTSVRIGLIIAFLGVFGSAIYWGSSINAKLDSILTFQSSINSSIAELKASDIVFTKDLAEFKLRQALNEASLKTLQDKTFITR